MSVVRCSRCDQYIDLDYNCEVFTNDQIPGLSKDPCDWVCFECLTDEEVERMEEQEVKESTARYKKYAENAKKLED